MLRRLDPRFNPILRPHEWERTSLRNRRWSAVLVGLFLGAVLGAAAYWYYPRDLTRELAPEAVAEAAGTAILRAPGYRFVAELTGVSRDDLFPTARMNGEYQRAPQVLHLAGEVVTGENRVPLEYYLDGTDLYVKHPTNQSWMLLKDSELNELASFYPDNLAAPLLGGLRKAEVLRRERLPGGEALVLQLDLDPDVMLPSLHSLRNDQVEYMLWVYTHTLKPARFGIDVVRKSPSDDAHHVVSFSYRLDWDFGKREVLSVPGSVRQEATELGPAGPDRQELLPPMPGRPPEGVPTE